MLLRAALVASVLALVGPAAASAAPRTKTCEIPPPDGAGYYGLKVKGVTCATGRTLLAKVEAGKAEPTGETTSTVQVRRSTWSCRTTFPAYEQARATCRSGARRIVLYSGA